MTLASTQTQTKVMRRPSFTPALLQRKCACGTGPSGFTGECEECSKKKMMGLQTKLRVNEPGDAYEQEADRVADQVLAKPAHADVGRAPPQLQRSAGQSSAPMAAAPASVRHALSDPGKPLEPPLRRDMEHRFGHDFSRVRVHCGPAADRSARAVNAHAYTVGHQIVFGAGQFAPHMHQGRHLLAHELAHVLQQREGAPPLQRKKTPPPDPLTYDPTRITIVPPEAPISLAEAQAMTQKAITDGELTAAAVSGAKSGSDEEIMLHFILALVGTKDRWGTEVDLVAPIGFPPSKGAAAPVGKVTVRIDPKGSGEAVLISTGAVVIPATFTKREDAEKKLQSKFGISEVKDGDAAWSIDEVNIVLGAFDRIPSGDIKALKGVALERVHTASGEEAGEFKAEQGVDDTTVTNEATLKLADAVFPATPTNFIGGKGNEAAAGFMTVLHEVGHAVESKAKRDALDAQFRATAKRNELVEQHEQALETESAELDALNALVDEFNTLTTEANAALDDLAAAKKSGDKDAIAAAQAARDAKVAERTAKGKEVANQRAKFQKAQAEQKAKSKKVETATKTEADLKTAAEKTTARPTLLKRANEAEKKAVSALKRANAAAKSKTDDSEAYRTAADEAGKALAALADAVKKKEETNDLRSAASDAVTAVESERASLEKDHPDDPAIKTYGPVVDAQRAWLDALELAIDAGEQTLRVRKFVDFVTEKKIEPFTEYAREKWPDEPEEFFAEAYSLFLSDPEFLKKNSKDLFDFFKGGKFK